MATIFLVCATLGGTILVCQLIMTLVGLGGDSLHMDAGDGGDLAGDVHDFGGDMHGHMGGATQAGGDAHAGGDTHGGTAHPADPHHISWFVGMLSFRTIVAALTFFGLAGMASLSAGTTSVTAVVVALAAGAAAMYGVYWMMRGLYLLKAEGTARIDRAVGQEATVYLRVPPQNSGSGKIQINLQNRTMEYSAVTGGDEIPTGARVVVVQVVNPSTVAVEPAVETERSHHV